MKEFLLVEKSTVSINKSTNDSYVLEGIFTELGSENRNGRVYTKEGFLPHLETLQKIVEAGKCVGELDHPKVFETSLKNASHVIEKIWFDENDNKVYGRIKLLDTDAGKNAKALVDAGVPLHISSRAAGTVAENKTVKIHKLFTYDLVADPGFENAVLNSVNESYGFDNNPETANFFIYDVNESKEAKGPNGTQGPVGTPGVNLDEFVTEEDLNKFSKFTKEAIDSLRNELSNLVKIQEALTTQNDEIAESLNTDSVQEAIDKIEAKITGIEEWAEHVVEEFNSKTVNEDVIARIATLEEKLMAVESWSVHVTETVTGIENWSEHVTETVTAIETWTDEASNTVTALEEWSEHTTETVTGLENVSEEISSKLEEGLKAASTATEATKTKVKSEKIVESLDETYVSDIYTKIDSIIENAKKQKAEEIELVEEGKKAEAEKTELPIWLSMMPEKYSELWEALSESKKVSIEKRANICDFSSEKNIKEFWDATFAGATIEMIKESSKAPKQQTQEELDAVAAERRKRIVEGFHRNFGN